MAEDARDELLPPPRPNPALTGTVVVRPTADDVIDALAAELLIQAQGCARQLGEFHLALSGGSTPLPLYRRLMYDPVYRQLPWERTHLWIVDERRVPFDDERSNFRAIDELIVQHSGIPRSHVHPMLAMSDDADERYENELTTALARRERGQQRLDFVVLGMGADAHTASLFPHSPALQDDRVPPRLVRINSGEKVTPPDRVTMTLPLLNASRFVAVMVTGAGKRGTLAKIAARKDEPLGGPVEELPILGVRPRAGELRWYLDEDACP